MRFERIGLDQGLSELAVNAIGQDAAGFIWVGTEDGLDRYDGNGFVHFTHDRADVNSLPDNYVTDLGFDRSGRQWIATDGGGIARRMPGTSDFVPLALGSEKVSAELGSHVRVIRADRAGRIWIGTRDRGVFVVDALEKTHHYSAGTSGKHALWSDSILAFAESAQGAMWIGSDAGIELLDFASQQIVQRISPTRLGLAAGSRIRSLFEDGSGTLWIGTERGLKQFRLATREVLSVSASQLGLPADAALTIETIYSDREQRLWLGTSAGLLRFDAKRGAFDLYRNDPRDVESLPDDHVMSLFEDRSGLLWVGTKFGGLAKWNPRSWSFGHRIPDAGPDLVSRNVMSFAQGADGRLWIGTMGGGLMVVSPDGSRTTTLRAIGSHPSLSDDRVMALLMDENGSLWAGLMEGGLERISSASLAVRHYQHRPGDARSLGANGVMSLFEDHRRRIWVGTYGGGLSEYDPRTDDFRHFSLSSGTAEGGDVERITALAEDAGGRLWIGTDGEGIAVLQPDSGKVLRLRHDPGRARSLSSDAIFALYPDPAGTIWIGTRGAGLDFTTASGIGGANEVSFNNLSERDGLPNNSIYGIMPDQRGNLWLSTNHGLAKVDPLTRRIIVYRRSHGLQADEFNFGAHYRAPDGRLLFGGPNGYNAFFPDRVQINPLPPPVALTSITAVGRALYPTAAYERVREVHLKHTEDVVTFEFAALDFAAPEANAFAYRLEGFDRDWNETGSRGAATYTHLPGGRYVLRVRASNSDGVWNPDGLSVGVEMDPPPWMTGQAYAGYTLACLASLGWLWRRQRLKAKRRAQYQQQLETQVRQRTSELAQRNVDLRNANKQLEAASFTDPLTGLGNRRSLDVAVPGLIESLKHENRRGGSGARLAVLIVDLDRLKPINDQLGHEAGDLLLKEVASILRACVRENDKTVRWGGDEFVVVHQVHDLQGAAALAERIRHAVAKRRFQLGASEAGRTSCSIGFALYPFSPALFADLGWEKALGVADANLYRAKKARNAWVGCAGTRPGSRPGELESRAQKDLESAERDGLVAIVRSGATDGDTVNLFLKRPAPPGRGH